jgi:uncharacterized protein (TIGR02453 family)
MAETPFPGFPRETIDFLRELALFNDKLWFDAHRAEYERHLLAPSRAFVASLGNKMKKLAPGLHADPRTNQSLFRIYRDTRFSADKSPYKTHLGLWFWEGDGPRMDCPGFYFHLEPTKFFLASGWYVFPKTMLDAYRRAVVDPRMGTALKKAVKKVEEVGPIGGTQYKRTPKGYDPDHPNAPLLLHGGLWVGTPETTPPDWVHTPDIVDRSVEQYEKMLPLHRWCVNLRESAS